MEELIIQAPAKINLHLQVVNKREDGFHNISSLFSLIDLSDTLSFKENGNKIKLSELLETHVSLGQKVGTMMFRKTIYRVMDQQDHQSSEKKTYPNDQGE